MTKEEANAIYDILVRECGAAEGDERHWNGRDAFVREFTRERPTIEYRFLRRTCGYPATVRTRRQSAARWSNGRMRR